MEEWSTVTHLPDDLNDLFCSEHGHSAASTDVVRGTHDGIRRFKKRKRPRVPIDAQALAFLAKIQKSMPVPVLAKHTGLPYLLIYNVIHERVKTVSDRHYRLLFGETPHPREPRKVDGSVFRKLVRVWLYLKELTRKEYFNLISTKYEALARKLKGTRPGNVCMQ